MIVDRLRRLCRHDSRSVEDCPNCEAADEIESLQRANAELLKRNVVLSSTPEPPAPASKEQFTDLLLELEHAAEVYGQSGGQSALHSVREARAAVLAAWPTPEPPAVLRAPVDGPFEPWSAADGRRGVMDAHNGITFVVHGFVDDNELRTYCEQLSSTLNARTAQPPPAELNVEKLARDAGFKTGQGSYHLNISGTDENLRRFAELVRSAQPPAPALAEYTHAIGDAAEAYLKSRGGDPLRLPGSFYWMELWNAMRAAACSGITKSGDAT